MSGVRGEAVSQEKHDEIVRLVKGGMLYEDVAKKIGCHKKTVYVHIQSAKKNGELPEGRTTHAHYRKRKVKFVQPKPKKLPERPEGIVVKCTKKISRECVYGLRSDENSDVLCNYILCEGHPRGCDPSACDRFSRRSKDNPKRTPIC